MNQSARHLLHVENLVRGVLNAPCCDDEIGGGYHHGELRNEQSAALNAIKDADVAASGIFGMSNVCDEVFRHVHGFQQFQFRHDCPPTAASHDHATLELAVTSIRRGIALVKSNSKALEGRGIPPRASVHHGEGLHRNPRKNHLNPKYVSAISIAAPIHHHIQNLCAFVARCIRSNLKSVRLAVAAVGAVFLSARPTLAGADRELVAGR